MTEEPHVHSQTNLDAPIALWYVKNVKSMSEAINIFKEKQFKCSVSSVLNKDVKQHGKAFMFDGLDDTAWYSDQGLPQIIVIRFDEPIDRICAFMCQLQIKFQGGFVGSVFQLKLDDPNGQTIYQKSFYPDDVNDKQIFPLAENASNNGDHGDNNEKLLENIKKLTISFEQSSDFFGRIIIYDLEMYAKLDTLQINRPI